MKNIHSEASTGDRSHSYIESLEMDCCVGELLSKIKKSRSNT